jgi:Heterokaryon incompatibility protein (HET)
MAKPIEPTLDELEDAMEAAFSFDAAENHASADDPLMSKPEPAPSVSTLANDISAQVAKELASKYPMSFGGMSNLREQQDDLVDKVMRDPQQMGNLLSNLNAIQQSNLNKMQTLKNLVNSLGQTGLRHSSPETDEAIASMQNSTDDAAASLGFAHRETPSLVRLLDSMNSLISGDKLTNMFDPAVSHMDRLGQVRSLFGSLNLQSSDLSTASNGVSSAHKFDVGSILKNADSFLAAAQDMVKSGGPSGLLDLSGLEKFAYLPLPTESSIRLLRLEPVQTDDKIFSVQVSLHVVDLDDKPEYNALSYVWGDHRNSLYQQFKPNRSKRQIDIECNGRKIAIYYSLFCALKRLCSSESSTHQEIASSDIWIDQLSINQQDTSERSQQVAFMDRIYRQAKSVVAWLGEEDSNTEQAIQLLDILADIPKETYESPTFEVISLVQGIESMQWLSLCALFSRPYFRRAWIVQEVALASKIVPICGDKTITWETIERASRFLYKTKAWSLLTTHASVFRSVEQHLKESKSHSPAMFGENVSALLQARDSIMLDKLAPSDLLYLGQYFESTDPRDKFYAMLGLAKMRLSHPGLRNKLPYPDYELPLEKTALEFAAYHAEHSGDLQILSFVEDRQYRITVGLPSWVPDPAAITLPKHLSGDVFPKDTPVRWNAYGSHHLQSPPVINEGALVVEGKRIDSIAKIATSFNDITENDKWQDLFEFLDQVKSTTVFGLTHDEIFVRTLTCAADSPLGKQGASDKNLQQEFRDWVRTKLTTAVESHYDANNSKVVSLIYSVSRGRIFNFEEGTWAQSLTATSRLDDLKYDMAMFGKNAKNPQQDILGYSPSGPRDVSSGIHRVMDSSQLFFNNFEKMQSDISPENSAAAEAAAEQLEKCINRLWAANPEGPFPSPGQVQKTLSLINHFKTDDEAGPERTEVLMRIDGFKAALGAKLESRRLFTTDAARMGMGAQSLTEKDEIWVLRGAKVPVILKQVEVGQFQFVGEAFLYGAMHGEAVKGVNIDEFQVIRLE